MESISLTQWSDGKEWMNPQWVTGTEEVRAQMQLLWVALFTLDFPVKSRSLVQFAWQRPWFPFWLLQAEHSITHPWGQTVPSQDMESKAWLWGQQLTVICMSVMLHCWLGGPQGTQLLRLSLLVVHFKARTSFYHSKSEFSALVFMLVWDIGSSGNKPGIGSTWIVRGNCTVSISRPKHGACWKWFSRFAQF